MGDEKVRAMIRYVAGLGGTKPEGYDALRALHEYEPGAVARMDYADYMQLSATERRRQMLDWMNEQGFVCEVCRQALDPDTSIPERRPVVDHIHTSKEDAGPVRGVLHSECNIQLGTIEKRGAEWTRSALLYLQKYGRSSVR